MYSWHNYAFDNHAILLKGHENVLCSLEIDFKVEFQSLSNPSSDYLTMDNKKMVPLTKLSNKVHKLKYNTIFSVQLIDMDSKIRTVIQKPTLKAILIFRYPKSIYCKLNFLFYKKNGLKMQNSLTVDCFHKLILIIILRYMHLFWCSEYNTRLLRKMTEFVLCIRMHDIKYNHLGQISVHELDSKCPFTICPLKPITSTVSNKYNI